MYKTTILLLILVIAVSSYFLNQFPYSVILAVITCLIIEAAIKKVHHKRQLEISYTAIITGLIIGSVAPSNAPAVAIVLASIIAVMSKLFIKVKGSNIFNPASFGLVIALALFGIGDSWWVAAPFAVYGVLITITPLLIICSWEARRLYVGASFAIASFAAQLLLGGTAALSVAALWTTAVSVNYFLAFIMACEPKTSPVKKQMQVIYGVGLALLVTVLSLSRLPYPLQLAILAANLAYAFYRTRTGSR